MTTLLTITHDPEGKQFRYLSNNLFTLFDNIFMVATEETNKDLLAWIKQHCILKVKPQNGMCQARRDVVKLAYEYYYSTTSQYFYCDFDRLLFWWNKYPDELREVIKMQSQFLVLGRTEKAMSTYPILQYQTERAMSKIVKRYHGFNSYDFFAGARLFSPVVLESLIGCKGEDAILDVEWLFAAYNYGVDTQYLAVDGLAYETEFLGMTRPLEDEVKLRIRNLKSILDFVGKK